MTQVQQPEALRLAAICETKGMFPVADELNRMHARILELEQGKCLHQIAEPAEYPEIDPALFSGNGPLWALIYTWSDENGVTGCDIEERIRSMMRAYVDADRAQRAAAPQAVQPAVPVLFVSREQLESHTDHLASEAGRYLPARKTAVGKFTMPLYAHPAEGVPAHELIDWDSAHKIAFQAAAAFRPSYFKGAGFVAHNWVVEAIRSAHIDGQRHAMGLPTIDRSASFAEELCKERASIQPAAQGLEADGMYYLQDARHHAMVGNCPSFWREGGGYTTNLDEAERFTLEAAMKQHKCRETDLPWLCSEVDKLRRPTVDCQYMPRSWDTQRAALAAQAKQGAPNGQ